MANQIYEGKYFKINGGEITIFGMQGSLSGNIWHTGVLVSCDRKSYIPVFGAPNPVLPEVTSVIQSDIDAQRDDKIAHVVVSNDIAVFLWLEGALTRSHFEQAEETSDEEGTGVIALPGVKILGRDFNVAILDQCDLGSHRILTVDAEFDPV